MGVIHSFIILIFFFFHISFENELFEKNGQVVIEAENYTTMTGNWKRKMDQDRVVMRMSGPDGNMFEGRHMYLAYRIRFTKTGRYKLWGLMRSTGTKATDDVWVYWNREPQGDSREDYELKVEYTTYTWSSTFKDLQPPEPDSKRPKNRDFAENGFRYQFPEPIPCILPKEKSLLDPIIP
jgi:hypothetical protein